MRLPLIAAALIAVTVPALAHDEYTGARDPVTGGLCCSTATKDGYGDCHTLEIRPGTIEGTPDGYRIRLTAEEAQRINPIRRTPVDTVVPFERVQESKDGKYRICIPPSAPAVAPDFFCFWAPPNT